MSQQVSEKKRKKKQNKSPVQKNHSLTALLSKLEKTCLLKLNFIKTGPIIMLAVIVMLLLFSFFQLGLHFTMDLLIAQAFIAILFVFWGCFRLITKDGRLIESPLDLCIILLVIAYFISFFFAVHKRDALEELLKITSYLIVYLVTIDISRYLRFSDQRQVLEKNYKHQKSAEYKNIIDSSAVPPGLSLLLHLALSLAVVMAVASIGAAAGNWDIAAAYADYRIATPMGYANAGAAFLMGAYLLAIGLAPLSHKFYKVLYLAPATLLLISVILTFSRGAWLLLFPMGVLLVLIASPGERVRSFLYLLITAVIAIPIAFITDPLLRAEAAIQVWGMILFFIVLSVPLGLLAELYLRRSSKHQFAIAGAAAVVGVAFIINLVLNALGPVQLKSSVEDAVQTQRVEQLVRNIIPGENYNLSLKVKAELDLANEDELPTQIWGIKVLEGLAGYENVELINFMDSVTDGWEERNISFKTSEEAKRMEVHIYNNCPNTSVTVRDVHLSTEGQEHNLHFAINRMLPDRFYNRLFSHSFDRNLEYRIVFYQDAAKIIRDYPILGTGGGGWNALYRNYQDIEYGSSVVHNHFLQVWIEAGLLGFLAFTGIWISFAAAFIRNCIKKKVSSRVWQYWTASFIPVFALGAHSIIDWNFTLAAVGIFLFVLLGAGRSLDKCSWFGRSPKNSRGSSRQGFVIGITGVIGGVVLLVYIVMLAFGLNAAWRSNELIEQGNYKQAEEYLKKAIQTDPFRSSNYHNLSILIESRVRAVKHPAVIGEMIDLAQQAYEFEPYNVHYVARYGKLLVEFIDIEKGLEYIDRMYQIQAFQASSFIQPAFSRLQLAEFLLEQDEREKAEIYLYEILEIETIMKEEYGNIKPLAYFLGRANYLLGDYDSAFYYYKMIDEKDDNYSKAQRDLEKIKANE